MMLHIISINSLIALLAFIVAIIGVLRISKKNKNVLLGFLAVSIFVSTIWNGCQQSSKDQITNSKNDSLSNNIKEIKSSKDSAMRKLDTINLFVKKLDSMGIKRDSLNNKPIINNKVFNNYIKEVGVINEY